MRCEILPSLEEPFVVNSSNLDPLLEMANWLVRLRMANECFILNNTNLAAIFAKRWPKDYQSIKDALPTWILFYNLAGYEYYPEERIKSYITDINEMSQRLGVESVKAAGEVSTNEILKAIQQPCAEPYWKLRYKGACEDIYLLTIQDKIENLIGVINDQADKAGYASSDLGIYIQPIVQGTGYHCEFNLFYDPENSSESARIKGLSTAATKNLMAHGGFFSRPYGENAGMILNRDAATIDMLNRLKKMFDPNKIMNPGKICF